MFVQFVQTANYFLFIGSFVEFNELSPLLNLKAEAELAGAM